MKLPRDLSGAELINLLCKHYAYRRVNQEGSHVILETSEPRQHRISIPDHSPLRIGTLNLDPAMGCPRKARKDTE